MVLPTQITFAETPSVLSFTLKIPGISSKKADVLISRHYLKVNSAPYFWDADLRGDVDFSSGATTVKINAGIVQLSIPKNPNSQGLWGGFKLEPNVAFQNDAISVAALSRQEIAERRKASIAEQAEWSAEKDRRRSSLKHENISKAQNDQWKLDREVREWIDGQKEVERRTAEEYIYGGKNAEAPKVWNARQTSCNTLKKIPEGSEEEEVEEEQRVERREKAEIEEDMTAEVSESEESDPDLIFDDDKTAVKEIFPPPRSKRPAVAQKKTEDDKKEKGEKEVAPGRAGRSPGAAMQGNSRVELKFTKRENPNLPAREGKEREPPLPKDVKAGAGRGEEGRADDPVWLKDRGDSLASRGDFRGAVNAYSEALLKASNAACFANRSLCRLHLGDFEECLNDIQFALEIIAMKQRGDKNKPAPPADPEDNALKARVHWRAGVVLLWLGDFDRSLRNLRQATDVQGGLSGDESAEAFRDLQAVERLQGAQTLKEEGDSLLKEALGVKSEADRREKAQGERDQALLESKRLAGCAVEFYKAALQTGGDHPVLLANLSHALLEAGETEEGLATSDRTLSLLSKWNLPFCPGRAPAFHYLQHAAAGVKAAVEDEDPQQKKKDDEGNADPKSEVAKGGKGFAEPSASHPLVRPWRKLEFRVRMRRGTALETDGRLPEALEEARRALTLEPVNPSARSLRDRVVDAAALGGLPKSEDSLAGVGKPSSSESLPEVPVTSVGSTEGSRNVEKKQDEDEGDSEDSDGETEEGTDRVGKETEILKDTASRISEVLAAASASLTRTPPDFEGALVLLEAASRRTEAARRSAVLRRGAAAAGGNVEVEKETREVAATLRSLSLRAHANASLCCQKTGRLQGCVAKANLAIEHGQALRELQGGALATGPLKMMAAASQRKLWALKQLLKDEKAAEAEREAKELAEELLSVQREEKAEAEHKKTAVPSPAQVDSLVEVSSHILN
uniref:CS domain-containing protein n=1 Tax=Chromera velia CCMP2878 TaxID=1169474 RepID=A0A0G4H245_9ALVE|eukprot:Cvel_24356.t1-p1 / transcript=Cvel_24356.t1 / gene=Cvel_24356 / organism=Chromera_velia_CCMP2878 / gene_product=Dyslexia susceptibility 1 candidate gene 1 protein, putative / transcript_product=Dyslexia susceptibility 1 candidate gene 1 protein, putative / location=Cvel_scaffold2621:1372-7680(-) / protein_length=966 / sequence_SO=supercontig / SO=protein_coding / is_pseudo=false